MIDWVTFGFYAMGNVPRSPRQVETYAPGIAELKENIESLLPNHYVDDIRERSGVYLEAVGVGGLGLGGFRAGQSLLRRTISKEPAIAA